MRSYGYKLSAVIDKVVLYRSQSFPNAKKCFAVHYFFKDGENIMGGYLMLVNPKKWDWAVFQGKVISQTGDRYHPTMDEALTSLINETTDDDSNDLDGTAKLVKNKEIRS